MVYLFLLTIVTLLACPATCSESWNVGVATTYANYFEGRPMANGDPFHHRDRVVACRLGKLGSRVELRYGENGRSVVCITDRGRLPMHRDGAWQFDVSRKVAQELGLYNPTCGRKLRWRFLSDQPIIAQRRVLDRGPVRPPDLLRGAQNHLVGVHKAAPSDHRLVLGLALYSIPVNVAGGYGLQTAQRWQALPVHDLRRPLLAIAERARLQDSRGKAILMLLAGSSVVSALDPEANYLEQGSGKTSDRGNTRQ